MKSTNEHWLMARRDCRPYQAKEEDLLVRAKGGLRIGFIVGDFDRTLGRDGWSST